MNERYTRQSFLGAGSEEKLASTTIAVAGLGGGGSHIVQQLAHVGIMHFELFDEDVVEESNLNRMVGAVASDVENRTPKVEVAQRIILGLSPAAYVNKHRVRWQEASNDLRAANVVVGCVDTARGRDELEREARHYLLPYFDIGLDVHTVEPEPPQMAGQVFVSLPGQPCMHCAGFLTKEDLEREATNYRDAGGRPQVVWANGVLASLVVGLVVDLVTGWTRTEDFPTYLSYDANRSLVRRHNHERPSSGVCPHYPPNLVGAPRFVRA